MVVSRSKNSLPLTEMNWVGHTELRNSCCFRLLLGYAAMHSRHTNKQAETHRHIHTHTHTHIETHTYTHIHRCT